MIFPVESATSKNAEVGIMGDIDGDLIAILHVCSYARKIDQSIDAKGAQLCFGSDTRQLEQLSSVEGSASQDDLLPCCS
jgi:hypothetical protein